MSDERKEKNEVFSAKDERPQGVDPSIPAMSAADAFAKEFGLDIPHEVIPLPSAGKVYPKGSALHGRETVDIRAMTAREEDILTSQALLKKGTVITELIKSCMTDKSVDPSLLLTGDRNALMVAIRITGYGHIYDAEVTCTDCDMTSAREFNLAELPLKRLQIEPVEPGMNLFEHRLPYTKKLVKFRFMTGRDEEEIMARQERQKKLGLASDSLVTTNLLHSIVSVGGVEDRAKIAQFVRMMPARDSLSLRDYVRENEPGIEMRQEVTCENCGHIEEVGMPLGVKFLWPSTG